jgi:voltage-gated potassium channel
MAIPGARPRDTLAKVTRLAAMLSALALAGTAGFMLIEGWEFLDALYMAVITLTTVGFREVHELSRGGQIFVIVYLVFGFGAFFYGAVQLGELVMRAELSAWLGKMKMDSTLKSLRNHVIVCGFGRMGRTVCRHLAEKRLPFVVVERNAEAVVDCQRAGWPYLVGDATDDQTLAEAGIARAAGLATVLSEDADNVYVVLSARLLSKELTIMARASDEKSAPKLRKAGADRVVSLYEAGATKIAELLANPNLEEFLELSPTPGREVDIAEIHVDAASPYAGRTVGQSALEERGVLLVGLKRKNGELMLPPKQDTRIEIDDALIAVGRAGAVATLLAGGRL